MDLKAIPPADTATIKEAMGLVRDVFWDFEAPEYSDEGILEFERFIAPEAITAALAAGQLVLWGAFVAGRVIGAIALRPPCHISLLFVEKRYHRKGVGTALFRMVADYCRAVQAGDTLTVHASPYALPVYQRLGFAPTGPQQEENGLRFTPMACALSAVPPLSPE